MKEIACLSFFNSFFMLNTGNINFENKGCIFKTNYHQQTLDVIIPSIKKRLFIWCLRFGKTNTFASKRNNCGQNPDKQSVSWMTIWKNQTWSFVINISLHIKQVFVMLVTSPLNQLEMNGFFGWWHKICNDLINKTFGILTRQS
jgi:hypothetical protein